LKITVGGIPHLLKSSEEWAKETLSLLEGEIAWEVNLDGDTVTSWYMLMGDGYPANGGERPPYTRLRVRLDDFPIKPAGKSLNSLISYINEIFSDIEALWETLNAHMAASQAHDSTPVPTPNRIAMFNEYGGLKSGKVPSQPYDVIRKTELDAEASAREEADNALQDGIEVEARAREEADAALQDGIEAEARDREEADNALSYAFNDLYNFTMDTAGTMTRFADEEMGEAASTYERRLDKSYGYEEYREADNAGEGWDSPFVTDQEYNTLYDFVMSLTGADILQLDVEENTERKPNRLVDKQGAGDDIRILDSNPLYGDLTWVSL
jgi:hypothetical protein